jgi:two-component system chemotaxis response regulator CheB
MTPLRVLVVDDSAYNRKTIAAILAEIEGVEVVGKAADGEDALRLVHEQAPDLVTLDLEMPRMDGFTFLRLLMARYPTPVIVISSHGGPRSVFRALELGAVDFVGKPTKKVSSELSRIESELRQKVEVVRGLSREGFEARHRESVLRGRTTTTTFPLVEAPDVRSGLPDVRAQGLVLIGASTGGPTALIDLFTRFPQGSKSAVVVAQHMPEGFTTTFAERLDRVGPFLVREASGYQPLLAGRAYVAPGGRSVEVARAGEDLGLRVVESRPADRYAPSIDRLLTSAASVAGSSVTACILTGMGEDGAKGAIAVRAAGGRVIAESRETAVIFGMPGAAERTGCVEQSLPLPQLADYLRAALASKPDR